VKAAGWEILDLDAVARRVTDPTAAAHPPFAAFTFDDGYLDNLTVALPVFRRHQAPLAIYLCTGFLDRLVDPWWSAVDRVIGACAEVILEPVEGKEIRLACGSRAEKESAYQQVWEALFSQDAQALAVQSRFYRRHKVDARAEMDRIALTWDQARELAADPLVTVGAHTVRHPVLTRLAPGDAEREMVDGRLRLESELGISVRHFAYPFGLLGRREIELARAAGFHTATTTHSGNLFAGQTRTLHCLPRRNFYENPAAIDPRRAPRFVQNSVRGCDLMVNAVRGRPRRITEDLWS
jgi:peptidoglycan/xylan/chitin deacetylase (PgdA/CDA1 family)